jgi:hypothetical protein
LTPAATLRQAVFECRARTRRLWAEKLGNLEKYRAFH